MKVVRLHSTPKPEKAICQAARNDYMSRFVGDAEFEAIMEAMEGSTVEEQKESLINHLLSHGHFGPFEHPHITIGVEGVSRSLMAQITRHRHVSFDIQSMRYVKFDEYDDEDIESGEAVVVIPELDDPGLCGRNAEFSGSGKAMTDEMILRRRKEIYNGSMEASFMDYKDLLDLGVAPENARMVLPIGTKVNMVFTINARMAMHIADMRAAADAQWEIREMTERVLDLCDNWIPHTMKHYREEMKGRKNRLSP